MTIKTLIHIHNLLIEEKETRNKAYTILSDAWKNAEKENAPNANFLENQKHDAWDAYMKATNALDDFEDHDWH